jgi:hypothetical protein
MIKLGIDEYFSEKGICVRYNTLGNDETLVRSYLNQFHDIVEQSERKRSEYVKHSCYSKLYNIESRIKYTGFEEFKKIDNEFRKQIGKYITKPQKNNHGFVMDKKENSDNLSYKEALLTRLKTVVDPVLYLSGGIDSELVALALLEANVKFTPVIFEFVDKFGKIRNSAELNYAYKFCKNNHLIPDIHQIDIETLWDSHYFKQLAIEVQISSPQIVTHVYMIEMLSIKYRNSTHLFGGEVRFRSNYVMDNGDLANIVFLNKVDPVGYNGTLYSDVNAGGPASFAYLYYDNSNGNWSVVTNSEIDDASGAFTTTPAFQYQVRITSATQVVNTTTGTGATATTPTIAQTPTNFFNLSMSVPIIVCGVDATIDSFGSSAEIQFTYVIECRSTTEPDIVVSSTIGLRAESSDL